jgi:hypothetical protein
MFGFSKVEVGALSGEGSRYALPENGNTTQNSTQAMSGVASSRKRMSFAKIPSGLTPFAISYIPRPGTA